VWAKQKQAVLVRRLIILGTLKQDLAEIQEDKKASEKQIAAILAETKSVEKEILNVQREIKMLERERDDARFDG